MKAATLYDFRASINDFIRAAGGKHCNYSYTYNVVNSWRAKHELARGFIVDQLLYPVHVMCALLEPGSRKIESGALILRLGLIIFATIRSDQIRSDWIESYHIRSMNAIRSDQI